MLCCANTSPDGLFCKMGNDFINSVGEVFCLLFVYSSAVNKKRRCKALLFKLFYCFYSFLLAYNSYPFFQNAYVLLFPIHIQSRARRQRVQIALLFPSGSFSFFQPLLCPPICIFLSMLVAHPLRSKALTTEFFPNRAFIPQTLRWSFSSFKLSSLSNMLTCLPPSGFTCIHERLSLLMGNSFDTFS